ncbi:MAG: 1-acyl-sn-glycerol-3-phosphate acyltransferase [Deltaproteobacteria bacterium]|nr:1-acyl-sn-glycerol-3-phosphate acyltransferase [Deltaproteobacteria bacterium]
MSKPDPSKHVHALSDLNRDRAAVIDEVVRRTGSHFTPKQMEDIVTDSLFWERKRLEGRSDPIRDALDGAFWKDLGSQLLNAGPSHEETVRFLMKKIVRHHADEIAGHYNDRVYNIATAAVPRGMGWLLQAFSWKSFRNLFVENVDLRRKIHLQGEIKQLQNLAKKGTVILVPTHFSNLDSVLVGWALFELGLPPFCYGAGLNLFTNPVFGFFMNNLGAYKVDRRKKHKLYKETLKHYSTVILERGCHSLFFPGGGRSRNGAFEKRIKLGLLSTAIDAYIANLLSQKADPNIYIVPCVISYHFVLEAATLIDDFLTEQGKSRYIIEDDESSKPKVVAQFLFNFLKTSSTIYLNFGQAIDPFGNLVDAEGVSLGAQGRPLDITSFVRSNGEICHNPQRDQEYTRLLGEKIVQRYKKENIALTSHFIAYAYFEYLRQKFGPADLFPLFRLSEAETTVSYKDFAAFTMPLLEHLHEEHQRGNLHLEPALRSTELRNILESAERNMGVYHTKRPLKLIRDSERESLACEDMKLLFYYHNRMEGYGLTSRDVVK